MCYMNQIDALAELTTCELLVMCDERGIGIVNKCPRGSAGHWYYKRSARGPRRGAFSTAREAALAALEIDALKETAQFQ